jgi:hypothetical protein
MARGVGYEKLEKHEMVLKGVLVFFGFCGFDGFGFNRRLAPGG